METESGRRVIRTSFWLTDETPPRRREDSSIPTDVGIETATTKLRVRRRSWPTAAPEDASPLENLVMDVLKSARRAFIRSPSLTKQSWSSGKHQSEYSCQQRDFLFTRVTYVVHPLASELDLSIVCLVMHSKDAVCLVVVNLYLWVKCLCFFYFLLDLQYD